MAVIPSLRVNGVNVLIESTTFKSGDGTAAAPAYAALSWPTNGLFFGETSVQTSVGGTAQALVVGGAGGGIGVPSNKRVFFDGGGDTYMTEDSANVLLSYVGGVLMRRDATTGSTFYGSLVSIGATSGIGYATGAGGAVTQVTSKSTGVTLNTVTGDITMEAGSLAANTAVSFTLTDSAIAATDLVVVTHHSGGTAGAYTVVGQAAAGSAVITLRNVTAGALAEAVVLKFAVIKGATS